MNASYLLVSVLVLLIGSAEGLAKGYPDKIVIQGNGLTRPIEITDRATLGKFSPWYGQFVDWNKGPVAKPDQPRAYEVLFYISVRRRKSHPLEPRLIFNVLYSPDPAGGPGLIYLPASSDDKYHVNQATITRDKADGRWHQASSAWEQALKPLLPVKHQPLVTQSTVASPGRHTVTWLLLALGIAGLGVVLVIRKKFINFRVTRVGLR